ncbi:MAG TPA: 4Fe-4S binding protein [Bacteroidales bacterium]|nr:4Fe-4S binding protein [Bacteroidales bacterium]HOK99508.1 4Fe-4S binding protein [Bacteroidales bacterium]HPO65707.1 4Fe-4S binding protein [Bacteroidales bacterium]
MIREIVRIDEEKCNGCGLCVPNCHEGALQIIDGKAVLVSELMCDGLGACVGHCPQDAITIEKREAEPYNERKVMEELSLKSKNVVIAHLKHLKEHNELGYLKEGIEYLMQNEDRLPYDVREIVAALDMQARKPSVEAQHNVHAGGCPGSRTMSFEGGMQRVAASDIQSALTHWPVQLHLINPAASHFQQCDLLVAADCTAFAHANFHGKLLAGKKLVIACPKLDANKEIYVEKLSRMVDEARVNTITVAIMEVPCCGGLLQIVQMALQRATRKVPVKAIVVGIRGEILQEEWV